MCGLLRSYISICYLGYLTIPIVASTINLMEEMRVWVARNVILKTSSHEGTTKRMGLSIKGILASHAYRGSGARLISVYKTNIRRILPYKGTNARHTGSINSFCALIMLIGVAGITVAGGLWILTKLTSDYRR